MSEIKLSDRQQIIVSIIRSNPTVSAKQMSETLSVTSRTIERDCQGYKRSFKDFYWLIFLDAMFETFNQCRKEESKWLDVLCALKKDENRNDCLKKNKWLFCFFKSNFPML